MVTHNRIGLRLALGFLIILIFFISLGTFAIIQMNMLSNHTRLLYDHSLMVSNAVLRINTNIVKMHRTMKDIVLWGDEGINENLRIVTALEGKVLEDFEVIRQEYLGERNAYFNAITLFKGWKPIREEVVELVRQGDVHGAANITKGKGAAHVLNIEKAMGVLDNFAQSQAVEFLNAAEQTRDRALHILYGLFAFALLASIIVAVLITRSITKPLKTLKSAIMKISVGNLVACEGIRSRDELGDVAHAFNTMVRDLIHVTASRNELNAEIYERKLSEEALRQSEERFKTLIEMAPVSISISSMGRHLFVNNAFVRMFNYENRDHLVGKPLLECFAHQSRTQVDGYLRQRKEDDVLPPSCSAFGLRNGGSMFPLEITTAEIKLDSGSSTISFIYDMTEREQAREALLLYEHIVSLSNDLMSFLDRDLIYRAANDTYLKFFGKRSSEIVGHHASEILGKTLFEESLEKRFQRCLNGEKVTFEQWYHLPDQRDVYLIVAYLPFKERDGRVSGVVVNAMDITEKKLFEIELQRKSRDLGERVRQLHCLYSISSFVENPELSLDEVFQKSVDILPLSWDDPDSICARITAASKSYVTHGFQETPSGLSSDIIAYGRKVGDIHIYSLRTPSSLDEVPAFTADELNLVDAISAQLGNFLEMQYAKERDLVFKRYAEHVSVYTGRMFLDKVVLFFAKEFHFEYAFVGKLISEHRIQTISLAADGRIVDNIEYDLQDTPCNNVVGNSVCVYKKDIQSLFPGDALLAQMEVQSYIGVPLFNAQGDPHGIIVILGKRPLHEDEAAKLPEMLQIFGSRASSELEAHAYKEALELKTAQLEKAILLAESANSSKSEFLSNMSHEIRTPLNGIIGLAELLEGTVLTAEQYDYVRTISTASDSLLMIINDILDFSRIEQGKMQLAHERFSLQELLRDIIKILSFGATKRDNQLNMELDPAIAPKLISDPVRLRQVLINLIGNAIKFTSGGSITLRVTRIAEEENTQSICFAVIDTGIGIPADKVNRIFDVFTQADGSISRRYGGSGLGLAIVKKIVTLMGGEIYVNSEEFKGSTFSFTIPMMLPDYSRHEAQTPEARVTRPEFDRRLNILLAEDNLINQKLATRILEKEGHAVHIAENGIHAVKLFKESAFDIILMDVQMPEMDGYDATRRIRELERQTPGRKTPIIALTAHVLSDVMEKCTHAGMDAYLSKPLKSLTLLQEIWHLTR